jgi:Cu+-exporting ATPase
MNEHPLTKPPQTVVDPICGMTIDPATAAQTRVRDGATHYFCSDSCAEQFDGQRAAVAHVDGQQRGEQAVELNLPIQGMHCASCGQTIEKALRAVPGVLEANVNVATNVAHVRHQVDQADEAALRRAVADAGYAVASAPADDEEVDEESAAHAREYKSLMRKFWFAAIVAVPVMLVAYPELSWFYLPYLFVSEVAETLIWWLFVISGLVTLPVMAYSGRHFFTGAWAAFKHHSADMNTLIALGTSAAWIYSTVALAFPSLFPEGTAEPFYDVTAVVTALVVLGQALEVRAKGQTSQAIRKLMGLQAKTARVVRNGQEVEIPVEDVLVGDVVIVRPGDKIPGRRDRRGALGRGRIHGHRRESARG